MKKSIVTLLIPFATLLLSCGGEEPCLDCVNNEVKGEVKGLYAKLITPTHDTTLLRSVDSVTQKTY